MSSNNMGEKYYSDGKSIAPMRVEFPNITKCIKCNTIFWIKNAKELGTFGWSEDLPEDRGEIQKASFLTILEYFEALKKKVYQSDAEERYIRINIWWTFNDRIRHKDKMHKHKIQHIPVLFLSDDEKKLWEENTYCLMGMLNMEDTNDRIRMAELNRNMGKFDQCIEIINGIENEDLLWIREKLDKKCRNKDPFVFRLNSEE